MHTHAKNKHTSVTHKHLNKNMLRFTSTHTHTHTHTRNAQSLSHTEVETYTREPLVHFRHSSLDGSFLDESGAYIHNIRRYGTARLVKQVFRWLVVHLHQPKEMSFGCCTIDILDTQCPAQPTTKESNRSKHQSPNHKAPSTS